MQQQHHQQEELVVALSRGCSGHSKCWPCGGSSRCKRLRNRTKLWRLQPVVVLQRPKHWPVQNREGRREPSASAHRRSRLGHPIYRWQKTQTVQAEQQYSSLSTCKGCRFSKLSQTLSSEPTLDKAPGSLSGTSPSSLSSSNSNSGLPAMPKPLVWSAC